MKGTILYQISTENSKSNCQVILWRTMRQQDHVVSMARCCLFLSSITCCKTAWDGRIFCCKNFLKAHTNALVLFSKFRCEEISTLKKKVFHNEFHVLLNHICAIFIICRALEKIMGCPITNLHMLTQQKCAILLAEYIRIIHDMQVLHAMNTLGQPGLG